MRELLQHMDSIEKLEVLLTLYRRRGHPSKAEDLAEELRVNAATLSVALSQLAAEGMLEVQGSQYAYPHTANAHEEPMQWLSAAYLRDRMSIISLMATQALERIRSSAMRMFAEAFRIREELP